MRAGRAQVPQSSGKGREAVSLRAITIVHGWVMWPSGRVDEGVSVGASRPLVNRVLDLVS